MTLPNCVWYVSGFKQPWEADVISNLGETLKARGMSLRVYVKGGTAHFHFGEAISWNSLTFFEKMKIILSNGKLWHLWGDAPSWWGIVRLRVRTVHTSLNNKVFWRGHPTRFFNEQANDGENRILPTFEPKASWTDYVQPGFDDKNDDNALILAWNNTNSITSENILNAWKSLEPGERFKQSKILVTDSSPSNIFQAAFMTMRGVPIVARDTALIKEVLGPEGYVVAPKEGDDTETSWKAALSIAASDTGRSVSAGARHYLKKNYSASAAAESLENLYISVARSKL